MEKKRKRDVYENKVIKKRKKEDIKEKCKNILCNKSEFIKSKCLTHLLIDIANKKIDINNISFNKLLILKKNKISDKLKKDIELVILTKTFDFLDVNN